MDFINPEFYPGIGVSVRRGDKWYNKARVGDTVELTLKGCENPVNSAKIVGIAYLPFILIPEQFLSYEHDLTCDNFVGLLEAMKKAYPDFSAEELVTIVIFMIDSE
jgi:hypothetical protein